jgi:dsRNA-specific ribonuclease
MEEKEVIHLDYSLKTAEERNALVNRILKEAPPSQLTNKYLEILGDYILDVTLTKEDRKNKYIT